MLNIKIANKIKLNNTPREIEEVLSNVLTVPNPLYESARRYGYSTRGIENNISLIGNKDGILEIPRGMLQFLIQLLSERDIQFSLDDSRVIHKNMALHNNIKLRDCQIQPYNDIMNTLKLPFSQQGVIVAPAGFGKTTLGLYLIANLKQPALWLSPTTPLIEQTIKEAINKGFDKDIIGIIQKEKFNIRPITIASVDTLVNRDFESISKNFGTVILDEAHHAPACTFTTLLLGMHSMYVLGLTATDFRRDKLEFLMFDTIGPKIAYIDRSLASTDSSLGLISPEIILTFTGIEHGYTNPDTNREDYRYMVQQIINNNYRNAVIIEDVVNEVKNGNRVVILSHRADHCQILSDMLLTRKINASLAVAKTMTPKQVKESILRIKDNSSQVLVATYQLIAEGFDCPELSCLFMATPIAGNNKGLLIQTIGRIERACAGKKIARVYDYVDSDGVLVASLNKRIQTYVERNLKFHFRYFE